MKNAQRNAYMSKVFDQMMADLTYPVAKDGSIMDATGIKPWVCWHLVRTGWRKPNNLDNFPLVEEYDEPVIKPRRVYGPGVIEDALTWVDFNAPDDPLADLATMTIAEIGALPPDLHLEAKRRLGLTPPPDSDPNPQPAWTVQPFVSITDAPDAETDWSTT